MKFMDKGIEFFVLRCPKEDYFFALQLIGVGIMGIAFLCCLFYIYYRLTIVADMWINRLLRRIFSGQPEPDTSALIQLVRDKSRPQT